MKKVTIKNGFNNFLKEKSSMSNQSIKIYKKIIDEFENFINESTLNKIKDEELVFVDNLEDDGRLFSEVFYFDKIDESDFKDFIAEYLSKRTYLGVTIINNAPRVMKKLTYWLFNNKFIDKKKKTRIISTLKQYGKLIDNIKNFEKELKKIIYTEEINKKSHEIKGIFIITSAKDGKLKLQDYFNNGIYYAIEISHEIDINNYIGWNISCTIVELKKKWEIIEIDKIFPVSKY